ncbi:MAG: DUF4105 domain-containing protein [Lentisphaeria bacterium]|nr:DUF4105 domain-containing protein [Lentisphaeria bacterium]
MMNWSPAAGVFICSCLLLIWLGSLNKKTDWLYHLLIFDLAIAAFFFLLTPETQFKDVQWEKSCAVIPQTETANDGKITIMGIRNFKYRTENDFDINYKNETFDPDKAESLDFAISHWDGIDNIAHTMLCFNFSDGKSVVLSVEMRCPEGTSRDYYTTLFKQHELIYIWASPEDILDLRSTYRSEALYIYRTTATPAEVKKLFTILTERTGNLYRKPEFYRTVSGNCTTELLPYLRHMRPSLSWDFRALLNGTIDRMFYEQDFLMYKPGESFEFLKARSLIYPKKKKNQL